MDEQKREFENALKTKSKEMTYDVIVHDMLHTYEDTMEETNDNI